MKFVKTFFVMCLIVIAAVPALAQNGQRPRNSRQNGGAACLLSQTAAAEPLDVEEADHLQYMREEEKLARDVYQLLYTKWNIRIFKNIAASEQRHFEAIGTLITRYKLSDPAQAAAGVFTNPDLQTLYNEMKDMIVTDGFSLLNAMQMGVKIEETDIADLQAAIAITKHIDVLTVYGNLLTASTSHLAAFDSHVDALSAN